MELQEVRVHQLQYLVQLQQLQVMEKQVRHPEDILQVEVQEVNKTLELNLAVLVAVEMRREQAEQELQGLLTQAVVVEVGILLVVLELL